MAINIIRHLLEKSDASGSKSTILKPLTWLLSILVGGLLLLLSGNGPFWLSVFFSVLISVVILIYLFAYIYCLFKDRDALRSEKFSIQKMAIERGVYGDNLTGIQYSREENRLPESTISVSDQAETEEQNEA